MADPRKQRPSPNLAERYAGLAATLVSAAVLFAVLNGLAALLLSTGWLDEEPGALVYGMEALRPAYPGRSPEEIEGVIAETWARPYRYEPFTQFREAPFDGRYVRVRTEGFRSSGTDQPWPPPADRPSVLAFGGSTLFGYGLSDGETLPARLEAALGEHCDDPPLVYNFGRSNYFSSQERILFQQLLAAGARPRAALFLDGLNEFAYPADEPKFTARLAYLMDETRGRLLRRWLTGLPLARLIKGRGGAADAGAPADADAEGLGRRVIARWLVNTRMTESVAAAFDVAVAFAWQPVPVHDAPEGVNPFLRAGGPALPNAEAMALGYERLAALVREGSTDLPRSPLLWLADAQRRTSQVLYVDRAHYTAAFSDLLAGRLAADLAPLVCGPAS